MSESERMVNYIISQRPQTTRKALVKLFKRWRDQNMESSLRRVFHCVSQNAPITRGA